MSKGLALAPSLHLQRTEQNGIKFDGGGKEPAKESLNLKMGQNKLRACRGKKIHYANVGEIGGKQLAMLITVPF